MLVDFRREANRTSIQTKINSIFNQNQFFYDQTKHFEKAENFFAKFGKISVLFNSPKLFQNLAFTLSVIMNLLILFGYNVEGLTFSSTEERDAERLKNINLFFTRLCRIIIVFGYKKTIGYPS